MPRINLEDSFSPEMIDTSQPFEDSIWKKHEPEYTARQIAMLLQEKQRRGEDWTQFDTHELHLYHLGPSGTPWTRTRGQVDFYIDKFVDGGDIPLGRGGSEGSYHMDGGFLERISSNDPDLPIDTFVVTDKFAEALLQFRK